MEDIYYRMAYDSPITHGESIEDPRDVDDLISEYLGWEKAEEVSDEDHDDKVDLLNDHLAGEYLTYKDGHDGWGLYWEGVCALDSLEALNDYFNALGGLEGKIWKFTAKYLDTNFDCDIVKPIEILEVWDV